MVRAFVSAVSAERAVGRATGRIRPPAVAGFEGRNQAVVGVGDDSHSRPVRSHRESSFVGREHEETIAVFSDRLDHKWLAFRSLDRPFVGGLARRSTDFSDFVGRQRVEISSVVCCDFIRRFVQNEVFCRFHRALEIVFDDFSIVRGCKSDGFAIVRDRERIVSEHAGRLGPRVKFGRRPGDEMDGRCRVLGREAQT